MKNWHFSTNDSLYFNNVWKYRTDKICDFKFYVIRTCICFVITIFNFQISFLGARITQDGRTAVLMSGRTVDNFQGTGLHRRLMRKLRGDFPNVTDFVFYGDVDDASQKLRSRCQCHYSWLSSVNKRVRHYAQLVVFVTFGYRDL